MAVYLVMSVINTVYGHHLSFNVKISVSHLLSAIFMIPLPFITENLEPQLAFWVGVGLFLIIGVI
jgi:hypothetical protein